MNDPLDMYHFGDLHIGSQKAKVAHFSSSMWRVVFLGELDDRGDSHLGKTLLEKCKR